MGQGQHTVEKGIDTGVGNAIGDGFRIADEELQQLGNENVHDNADKLCRNHGRQDAEQGAFLGTVHIAGPQILADEGGQGHAHGRHGQKCKALHLAVGTQAAHGVGTEGIDIGLNDHIAQTDHGVLNAGGQTLPNDAGHHGPVPAQQPEIQPQVGFRFPAHTPQA